VVNFDKVLGQAVAAHEVLFSIHDVRHAPVRGLVPERDAGRIRIGQQVRARFVANPAFTVTGHVARSAGMVGTENRSQAVWIELERETDTPLLHGQLARLTVILGRHPPALAVPRTAVVEDGAVDVVFVRRPDGVFERRPIETGLSDDRFVIVTRGLAEQELVAVSGASRLLTAHASLR
jgi:RND family efflux transporter MFP subunit